MIKKEYTKEGIKLTHPSGVVSVIPKAKLAELILREEKQKNKIQERIDSLKSDLQKLSSIT